MVTCLKGSSHENYQVLAESAISKRFLREFEKSISAELRGVGRPRQVQKVGSEWLKIMVTCLKGPRHENLKVLAESAISKSFPRDSKSQFPRS